MGARRQKTRSLPGHPGSACSHTQPCSRGVPRPPPSPSLSRQPSFRVLQEPCVVQTQAGTCSRRCHTQEPTLRKPPPLTTLRATSWGTPGLALACPKLRRRGRGKQPFLLEGVRFPPASCASSPWPPGTGARRPQLSGFPAPAEACAKGFSTPCWKSPIHPLPSFP